MKLAITVAVLAVVGMLAVSAVGRLFAAASVSAAPPAALLTAALATGAGLWTYAGQWAYEVVAGLVNLALPTLRVCGTESPEMYSCLVRALLEPGAPVWGHRGLLRLVARDLTGRVVVAAASPTTDGQYGLVATRASLPLLFRYGGMWLVALLSAGAGGEPSVTLALLWPRQGGVDALSRRLQEVVRQDAANRAAHRLPVYTVWGGGGAGGGGGGGTAAGKGGGGDGQFVWQRCGDVAARPPASVLLQAGRMEELVKDAGRFLASRRAYEADGRPYRRGYLFHGPPGTGKSSAAVAIATAHGLPLCVLSIGAPGLHDEALLRLANTAPSPAILLLEDVDCAGVQGVLGTATHSLASPLVSIEGNRGGVTLSGLLNVLDGAGAQEGRLVVMTTNHRERLCPALVRHGRTDVRVLFDYLDDVLAERMVVARFPDGDDGGLLSRFLSLLGPAVVPAALQAFLQVAASPADLANEALLAEYGLTPRKFTEGLAGEAELAAAGLAGSRPYAVLASWSAASTEGVRFCPPVWFRRVLGGLGELAPSKLRLACLAVFPGATPAQVARVEAAARGLGANLVLTLLHQNWARGLDACVRQLEGRAGGGGGPDVPPTFRTAELFAAALPQVTLEVASQLARVAEEELNLSQLDLAVADGFKVDRELDNRKIGNLLKDGIRAVLARTAAAESLYLLDRGSYARFLVAMYGVPVEEAAELTEGVAVGPGGTLYLGAARFVRLVREGGFQTAAACTAGVAAFQQKYTEWARGAP